MPGVVDVIADSDDDIAEIVDVTVDSEDDIVEVSDGGPPVLFHGYKRGRAIGWGASSQVFLCSRKGDPCGFALKAVSLRRMRLSSDAELEQKKLRREVDILKRLPPHRRIVHLVDAFEEESWFLLVLELIGGGDLFTALTSRETPRLFEPEAAHVVRQLCEGLLFLHRQGVIHRDLKLENVLIASERREGRLRFYNVKISDFGLSKSVGSGHSEAQSMVGTRPYTAPEVLRAGLHSFSSDIWCLGVLLYVLIAGHFPFDQLVERQSDLDDIVIQLKTSDAAKSFLRGLLQLEQEQRLSAEVACVQDWLQTPQSDDVYIQCSRTDDAHTSVLNLDIIGSPAEQTAGLGLKSAFLHDGGERVVGGCPGAPEGPSGNQFSMKSDIFSGGASADAVQNRRPNVCANEVQVPEMTTVEDAAGMSSPSIPGGAWTPLAVESSIQLSDVRPASSKPDVVQVHMVAPYHLAGFVLGKSGGRIQSIAADAGCPVWMTSRQGISDRRVVITGNYKQCKIAQELVHEQLTNALGKDWRDTEANVVLFVRAEAAGVVIGKQGCVLNEIREQSGARIQLLPDIIEAQRPCMITGSLQSVLLAERHIFGLVRAVPVAWPCGSEPAELVVAVAAAAEAGAQTATRCAVKSRGESAKRLKVDLVSELGA